VQHPLFSAVSLRSLQLNVERVSKNDFLGLLRSHIVPSQMASVRLIPIEDQGLIDHFAPGHSLWSLQMAWGILCTYSVCRFAIPSSWGINYTSFTEVEANVVQIIPCILEDHLAIFVAEFPAHFCRHAGP
jgi:hypothetical protein